MPKLLLSIIIEACIGVAVAGVLLAILVPALDGSNPAGQRDPAATIVIIGVLIAAVGAALLRPGSAIRRNIKR